MPVRTGIRETDMIKLRSTIKTILLLASTAAAAEPTLKIDAGIASVPVNPVRYGLMTEEINHSYDGGLYAELVQNRAFLDDKQSPIHWTLVQGERANGAIVLDHDQPLNSQLTTSLRLDATTASTAASVGVTNDGYW